MNDSLFKINIACILMCCSMVRIKTQLQSEPRQLSDNKTATKSIDLCLINRGIAISDTF